MRGGVRQYVAQETPQIDTEIGEKDHFSLVSKLHLETHGIDGSLALFRVTVAKFT